MLFRSIHRKLLLALIFLLASAPNHAALTNGSLNGTALDSISGLEWVHLGRTQSLSFNDVMASTWINDHGFTFATEAQVRELYENLNIGINNGLNEAYYDGATQINSLLGATGYYFTGNGVNSSSRGYYDVDEINYTRRLAESIRCTNCPINWQGSYNLGGAKISAAAPMTFDPALVPKPSFFTGQYYAGYWLVRSVNENTKPEADAGLNQTVVAGNTVYLDGTGSSDADGDSLIYQWSIDVPLGSQSALIGDNTAFASFVADVPGIYVPALVVNDGTEDSYTGTVTITAISVLDAISSKMIETSDACNALIESDMKNKNMKKTLCNKLSVTTTQIDQKLYTEALDKLDNDILTKFDGCFSTGASDKNDWIVNCDAQSSIHGLTSELTQLLRDLM